MLTTLFLHVCRTVKEWHRRNRSRRELVTLGAMDLNDFNWTSSDASFEARKWFWQR